MGKKALKEKVRELQRWALPTSPMWLRTDLKLHWHFRITDVLSSRTSHWRHLGILKRELNQFLTRFYKGQWIMKRFYSLLVCLILQRIFPLTKSDSILFHQVRIFERAFTMASRVLHIVLLWIFFNFYYSFLDKWMKPFLELLSWNYSFEILGTLKLSS